MAPFSSVMEPIDPINQQHTALETLFFILVIPLIVGCSQSMDATVKGRVTYNGQPVENAILQFGYIGDGPSAQAITITNGKYQVRTGSQLGATAGEYVVAISPAEAGSIPKKYTDSKTSGLTLQIKPGRNSFDIDLTDE